MIDQLFLLQKNEVLEHLQDKHLKSYFAQECKPLRSRSGQLPDGIASFRFFLPYLPRSGQLPDGIGDVRPKIPTNENTVESATKGMGSSGEEMTHVSQVPPTPVNPIAENGKKSASSVNSGTGKERTPVSNSRVTPSKINYSSLGKGEDFLINIRKLEDEAKKEIDNVTEDKNLKKSYMGQLKHARIELLEFSDENKISSDVTFADVFFNISQPIVKYDLAMPVFIDMMCILGSDEPSDDWFDTVKLKEKKPGHRRRQFIQNTPLVCDLIHRTLFGAKNFLNKSADQRQAYVEELLKNEPYLSESITLLTNELGNVDDSDGKLRELSAHVAFAGIYNELKQAYIAAAGKGPQDNNIYIVSSIPIEAISS